MCVFLSRVQMKSRCFCPNVPPLHFLFPSTWMNGSPMLFKFSIWLSSLESSNYCKTCLWGPPPPWRLLGKNLSSMFPQSKCLLSEKTAQFNVCNNFFNSFGQLIIAKIEIWQINWYFSYNSPYRLKVLWVKSAWWLIDFFCTLINTIWPWVCL